MNRNNIHLSKSDVDALCYALEIMSSYDDFETDSEAELVDSFSVSSAGKLINHQPLSNREIYHVATAVDYAFMALRGEVTLDDEKLSGLRPYMFTINKLHPVFAPFLDETL